MLKILYYLILIIFILVIFIFTSYLNNTNKSIYQTNKLLFKKKRDNFPIKKYITIDNVNQWTKEYSLKDKNLTNIISNNSIEKTFLNREYISRFNHVFSNKLIVNNHISDQRHSGRCWIFSFLNMLKYKIVDKYNLTQDFDLSFNYLFFFSKLEKCKYILDLFYERRYKSLENREVHYILNHNLSDDGGTWNMLVNLINKYGIVPKSVMRDTYHSKNTFELNRILREIVSISIFQIKTKPKLNYSKFINKKIRYIFYILSYFLGLPPIRFDWEVYQILDNNIDNLKKRHIEYGLTPITFMKKFIRFVSSEWIICGNIPLKDYPFYHIYNTQFCNNMIDGVPTKIFNIPINELSILTKKSIDSGTKVWFACDFGIDKSSKYGLLKNNIYNYSSFLKKNKLSKGDKIKYNIITPNHAMLFTGYDLNNNKIEKWLIENSHGEIPEYIDFENNNKDLDKDELPNGYFTMSNNWFIENVTQVVVRKQFLTPRLLKLYQEAISITVPPWSCLSCQLLTTK